jgi:hypothetical protein
MKYLFKLSLIIYSLQTLLIANSDFTSYFKSDFKTYQTKGELKKSYFLRCAAGNVKFFYIIAKSKNDQLEDKLFFL